MKNKNKKKQKELLNQKVLVFQGYAKYGNPKNPICMFKVVDKEKCEK